MLELERSDLGKPKGEGHAGVYAWWVKIPQRSRPSLALSWSTLVLLRPEVRWPEGFHPERQSGWGDPTRTFRFVYVKTLPEIMVRSGVLVPTVRRCLEFKRGDMERVTATRHTITLGWRSKLSCLTRASGSAVYIWQRALQRMSAAIEQKPKELDLRLVNPEWAPDTHLVLVYRSRQLRAVVSAITEADALGCRSS